MAHSILKSALASAVTAGLALTAQAASADTSGTDLMKHNKGEVRCFGVAPKGKNACGDACGKHTCAGIAKKANDPYEWIWVKDKKACKKMGGKTDVKCPKKK